MTVQVETRDGVLHLRLDRPEKRNALTGAMYDVLSDALERPDPGARVAWLRGSSTCFTAGNDLADFLGLGPAGAQSALRFLRALAGFPLPLVASVAGPAVGVGTTLLLHCDFVFLSADARLQLPFAGLGLCPEGASSLLLPRLAGHARAAEWLMLGAPIPPDAAMHAGIANAVLPDGDAADEAAEHAVTALLAKPDASLRATKALLRRATTAEVEAAFAAEAAEFKRLLNGPAAREAFTAFLEKRTPDFTRLSPLPRGATVSRELAGEG